jgi:putative membrane-bound dehydrogenase-like protein
VYMGTRISLNPLLAVTVVLPMLPAFGFSAEPADTYFAGVAQVDITPSYPVRLSGFGFRRAESEGVTQPIWAKALAVAQDRDKPALLITVDNLGIPDALVAEVAARLQKHVTLPRDRLAITATHTHTAPMLTGVAPTLFGEPIPAAHQEHIDRYTRELTDKLEAAALAALKDLRPARLSWGIGTVGFARNRRTAGGPVDHDLPLLVVKDMQGKIRALYFSYACHCVTLSNNKISGDWAGYAQDLVQRKHPGAIALVSVGCGADANPSSGVTGDKVGVATAQGAEIALEVERLLQNYLTPLSGKLDTRLARFDLSFDTALTRPQWEERAKRGGAIGYHARVQLAKLERGESIPTELNYSVQNWTFGDRLAMVFLPGEVVVDYALRLKSEYDPGRLWVNAYANDAPCYIPSERILKEGGYEGGDAMIYYDRPTRFRPGLEEQIVRAVREQLPANFKAPFNASRLQGTRPLTAQQSLATIKTKPGFTVELMAAEPLVASPVAIDFGPDGRLWVAEMADYPTGIDGKFKPGGRIRILEDTHGDGHYDSSKVFLEGIPFPTGIKVWRQGVLICAAPDIIYAEDTKRDGKADLVRKLYSGFATHNYQARVNSLVYGLDNWVYGSGGLFGGNIRSFVGGAVHPLTNRDFRILPDTGAIEAASGRAQQGRVRDDWDNWFGCDNSNLLWNYPLADHYLRRNPHVVPPAGEVLVPAYPDPTLLYPIKKDLQLFKLSGPPGRVTAACGLGIYRDELLGKEYTENAFTCEPVNLLIHRLVLQPKGVTFAGQRAADETTSEFLAGTDNWFRPVQIQTGPDGALWIVDMYRLVIEHPQWIPAEDLAKLDVRAGSASGRIYRVYPQDHKPRPMLRMDRLDTAGLVAALDSPNGPQRDLAQQMLIWKKDQNGIAGLLQALTRDNPRAETRAQALCTLDGLGLLENAVLLSALKDAHSGVRCQAVRLAEKRMTDASELAAEVLNRASDPDIHVQLQAAYSLGAWAEQRAARPLAGQPFLPLNPQGAGTVMDENAARALAMLALRHADDPYFMAAVLSSVNKGNIGALASIVLAVNDANPARQKLIEVLVRLTTAFGDRGTLESVLSAILPRDGGRKRLAAWQLDALAGMLDALERTGRAPEQVLDTDKATVLKLVIDLEKQNLAEAKADEAVRIAATRLFGRTVGQRSEDVHALADQLVPQNSPALQAAVIAALGRINDEHVPAELLGRWDTLGPALRSQILDVLLSRESWLRQLLTALEKSKVPAAHIDAARREILLEHKVAAVRERAAKVLAGVANPDRKKVLDEHQAVLAMTGDRPRGKGVFGKRCATCHQLEGVGHPVGPDLASMFNKPPSVLLIAILDPNQAVDNRYLQYLATTGEGRVYTGIVASETATSVTLRAQDGKEQVILRSDLEELRGTGKSLMPEGLEKDLSKQDLADLIAYLTSNGPPRKELPGNKPVVVKPGLGGVVRLPATACDIYGDAITFEGPFQNIGFWHGEKDQIVWTVELAQAGRYEVTLDYACDNGSAGNRFVLEGGEPALRGQVQGTGGWDQYRQVRIGTLTMPAGVSHLTVRPEGKPAGALLDLRGLRLEPTSAPQSKSK